MKHLNKPIMDVNEIVIECAESYQDEDLKKRLENSAEYIKDQSEEYDFLAEKGLWESFETHEIVNGILDKSEMKSLYTDKFAKKTNVKEKYYDKIMVAANGKCPICGIGQTSNLDHYLAKSLYPTYSVTPVNLIPICRDCNTVKSNSKISCNINAPFHPYYDDIDSFIWLKAELELITDNIVVNYYINEDLMAEEAWLYQRLCNHLSLYKLPHVYSIHASEYIAEHQQMWTTLLMSCGEEELKKNLKDCLVSYERVQKNTWKTALLRSIIENMCILLEFLSKKEI